MCPIKKEKTNRREWLNWKFKQNSFVNLCGLKFKGLFKEKAMQNQKENCLDSNRPYSYILSVSVMLYDGNVSFKKK